MTHRDFASFGTGIWVSEYVKIASGVSIGHASCIGFENQPNLVSRISSGVKIGAFCLISQKAVIEENVEISHYCYVGPGSIIGEGTKLLHGVAVYDNARIGRNCIVGGDIIDDMQMQEGSVFLGLAAHSFRKSRDATEWDLPHTDISPVMRKKSFVGTNTLIIGGVEIGESSYIAAGEVIRANVPANTLVFKGSREPLSKWRGFIST